MNIGDSYSSGGRTGTPNDSLRGDKNYGVTRTPANLYGIKPKDLLGIPWMLAFALRADGWYLRQDIIWHKPNPMPESVTDRCTKSHEYIFLLSKNSKYYYDVDSIREKTGNEDYVRKSNKDSSQYGNADVIAIKGSQHSNHHDMANHPDGRNKRSVWTVNTMPCKEAHFAVFPEKLIEPMIKAGCPVGGIVLDPFIGSGTTGRVARRLQRNFIGIDLNEKYCTEIAKKRLSNIQVEMIY